MNVRSAAIAASALLLMLWSEAGAASVSWMSGSAAAKQWGIDPVAPTSLDVIRFSGPIRVYFNSCEAERALHGMPVLLVDSKAKVITLWFQGPTPQLCPVIFRPVAGLEGELGPLPAGDWIFTCHSRDAAFELLFTVRNRFARHVDVDARGLVHNGRRPPSRVPHTKVGLHPIDRRVTSGVVSLKGQGEKRGKRRKCEECDGAKGHGGGQEHGGSPSAVGWCEEVPAGSEPWPTERRIPCCGQFR